MGQGDRPGNVAAQRGRRQQRRTPAVLAGHEHAIGDRLRRAGRAPGLAVRVRSIRCRIGARPNRAPSSRLLPAPSVPVTATMSPARNSRSKLWAAEVSRTSDRRSTVSPAAPGRRLRCGMRGIAADHRLYGGDKIERPRLIRHAPPVAQNDDLVGDAPDVAETMRNVKHADATLA